METFEQIYSEIVGEITPDVWESAAVWYPQARRFAVWLSNRYDVPLESVVGYMAVFSIRTSWGDNKKRLVRYLSTGEIRGTKLQQTKIKQIGAAAKQGVRGLVKRIMQVLSGDKIKRFFHNILFPATSPFVTLDSWMIGVLPITYSQLSSGIREYGERLYLIVERALRNIAKRIGKPVSVVQAAVWVYLRGYAY